MKLKIFLLIANLFIISCVPKSSDPAPTSSNPVISYIPNYQPYGNCSTSNVCEGVGTKTRTHSCLKLVDGVPNGEIGTESDCSPENLIVSCNSPAGNKSISVLNGTKTVSCLEGSTTENFQSANCDLGYHEENQQCVVDVITYDPQYTSYGNCSANVCDGPSSGTQSRSFTCNQYTNGIFSGFGQSSDCSTQDLTISCDSPAGSKTISILNGSQNVSCAQGSTTQVVDSVSCNSGYFQNGNNCDPDVITYSPVYSSLSVLKNGA